MRDVIVEAEKWLRDTTNYRNLSIGFYQCHIEIEVTDTYSIAGGLFGSVCEEKIYSVQAPTLSEALLLAIDTAQKG